MLGGTKRNNTLTEQERGEIAELYRQGDTLKVIAEAYHIDQTTVTNIAKKFGCPLRHPRRAEPKLSLEEQLEALDKEQADIVRRRQEIETLRAAKGIKFSWVDDTTLQVHGVTEKFRSLGGMAKLLEFIEHSVPQK